MKLKQESYFLQSVAANPYCSHVMPPFLDRLLAISPSCNAYPCTIYLCYKGFLVGSMLDGVARKPRAYAEHSTYACTSRHTLVLRLLIMIPYTTMLVCYLLVDISHIYPFAVLPRDLYVGPKSSGPFYRSYFERTATGRTY